MPETVEETPVETEGVSASAEDLANVVDDDHRGRTEQAPPCWRCGSREAMGGRSSERG